MNTFKFNADFVNYLQFTSTFRIFFKCNFFSTLSYFYQRQVSALTMLTNVIKYISIALVLFLFMFDCLLFRSYIPYFCPRVCDGSHLHKIIIDLDQILVIEDRLIDKIHPITLKSVINYTQLLFFQLSHPWKSHYLIRCSKKKIINREQKTPDAFDQGLWSSGSELYLENQDVCFHDDCSARTKVFTFCYTNTKPVYKLHNVRISSSVSFLWVK